MKNESLKDRVIWASFKNINVYIDQNKILSDINLNLRYGENILILGPNGSGKSTFLKLLNRSIYPITSNDSSFKLFNKENIHIWDLRKKIGFLFKEMEQRVNNGVKLYDVISSGFSGIFNSKYTNLLSESEKIKINNLPKISETLMLGLRKKWTIPILFKYSTKCHANEGIMYFLMKWNSPSVTQDSIIATQNFAILLSRSQGYYANV